MNDEMAAKPVLPDLGREAFHLFELVDLTDGLYRGLEGTSIHRDMNDFQSSFNEMSI